MFEFLSENAATILISAALLAAVAAIVLNMRKRARRGQCVSCDGCSKDGGCHCDGAHHKA